jgi:type III pantothenate kinase
MKLLAIDIGNTNVTFGVFDEEELMGTWSASTVATATSDELALQATGLLALGNERLEEVEAVAVASVVPRLTETVQQMFDWHMGVAPYVLDARSLAGALEIRIERPTEAGADRLANALAVRREMETPAIVVDLGTSTNFDVVSADGAYVGGAIAPGLGLSLEALASRAAKLPPIAPRRPARAIGTTTEQAMQSGAVIGYMGLVSGILATIRDELLAPPATARGVTVVATGGYAREPWVREMADIDRIDHHLTLRGIRYAWEAWQATARQSAREEVAG